MVGTVWAYEAIRYILSEQREFCMSTSYFTYIPPRPSNRVPYAGWHLFRERSLIRRG
jgi:hypothetical protein